MRLLKCICLFGLLLYVGLVSAQCPTAQTGNTVMRRIMASGKIRIATIANNPPFYWHSHGQLRGYDYEVMLNIAKRLGVKLEVVSVPSPMHESVILDWVRAGKVDMAMANLVASPDSAKLVWFTSPYRKDKSILLVNRKKMHAKSWGQSLQYFADKPITLAVIKHSFQATRSQELYPHAKLVKYSSYYRALKAVSHNGADAILLGWQQALYLIARQPDLASQLAMVKGNQEVSLAFAVNYASQRLKQWLDFYVTIGLVSDLGFLSKMNHKYFYLGTQNESF